MYFASSDVNRTSVKVSLWQWDLPPMINISLNEREWKKYVEKNAFSRCFWQKMKYWWGKDTDQNISARSLTLLILQWGGHCVVDHNPNMRVSDATAVTFSVKCFNPLKLYSAEAPQTPSSLFANCKRSTSQPRSLSTSRLSILRKLSTVCLGKCSGEHWEVLVWRNGLSVSSRACTWTLW